jgi:hypothetical protein
MKNASHARPRPKSSSAAAVYVALIGVILVAISKAGAASREIVALFVKPQTANTFQDQRERSLGQAPPNKPHRCHLIGKLLSFHSKLTMAEDERDELGLGWVATQVERPS